MAPAQVSEERDRSCSFLDLGLFQPDEGVLLPVTPQADYWGGSLFGTSFASIMVLQRSHLAQGGPRTKSQRAGNGEGELTLPLAWRCVSPSTGSQLPRPPGGHSSGWPLRSPSHPWGRRDIRGGAVYLLPGKGEGCRAPQKLTEGQLLSPQPLPLAVADCEDLVTTKQSPPSALIGTWVGHKRGEQMLCQARSPSSPQEGGSKHGSPPAPSQKALPRIRLSCFLWRARWAVCLSGSSSHLR